MYYDEYFPFYAAYANPMLYQGERMQEEEFELMKSYYPRIVQEIQERVEEECRLLDYEGSRIYDEYPDKYMFYHLCSKIKESMKPEIKARQSRTVFWMNWYMCFWGRKSAGDAAGENAAEEPFITGEDIALSACSVRQ